MLNINAGYLDKRDSPLDISADVLFKVKSPHLKADSMQLTENNAS